MRNETSAETKSGQKINAISASIVALILIATALSIPILDGDTEEYTVRYHVNYPVYESIIDDAVSYGTNDTYQNGTQTDDGDYYVDITYGSTITLADNPQSWDNAAGKWLEIINYTLGKTVEFNKWSYGSTEGWNTYDTGANLATETISESEGDPIDVYATWILFEQIEAHYGKTVTFPYPNEDSFPAGKTLDDFVGWDYDGKTYQPGEVVVFTTSEDLYEITPVFTGDSATRINYGEGIVDDADMRIMNKNIGDTMSPAILDSRTSQILWDYRFMSLKDGTLYNPGNEYSIKNIVEDMVRVYVGNETEWHWVNEYTGIVYDYNWWSGRYYNPHPVTNGSGYIQEDETVDMVVINDGSTYSTTTVSMNGGTFTLPEIEGVVGYKITYDCYLPDTVSPDTEIYQSGTVEKDVIYKPGDVVYAHKTITFEQNWGGSREVHSDNLTFTAIKADDSDEVVLHFQRLWKLTVYDPVEGSINGEVTSGSTTKDLSDYARTRSSDDDYYKYAIPRGATVSLTYDSGGTDNEIFMYFKDSVTSTDDPFEFTMNKDYKIVPILKFKDEQLDMREVFSSEVENGTGTYSIDVEDLTLDGVDVADISILKDNEKVDYELSIDSGVLSVELTAPDVRGVTSATLFIPNNRVVKVTLFIVGPLVDANI